MLTNLQVIALADRMGVPLEPVVFKSELKEMVIKYNKSYITNLEDEFSEDGEKNAGSHYIVPLKHSHVTLVIIFDSNYFQNRKRLMLNLYLYFQICFLIF